MGWGWAGRSGAEGWGTERGGGVGWGHDRRRGDELGVGWGAGQRFAIDRILENDHRSIKLILRPRGQTTKVKSVTSQIGCDKNPICTFPPPKLPDPGKRRVFGGIDPATCGA